MLPHCQENQSNKLCISDCQVHTTHQDILIIIITIIIWCHLGYPRELNQNRGRINKYTSLVSHSKSKQKAAVAMLWIQIPVDTFYSLSSSVIQVVTNWKTMVLYLIFLLFKFSISVKMLKKTTKINPRCLLSRVFHFWNFTVIFEDMARLVTLWTAAISEHSATVSYKQTIRSP